LENKKGDLPALTRLGESKRDRTLKNYSSKVDDEVRKSNKNVESEFDKNFEFEETYQKRFDSKTSKKELDEII
jgi:hypothetical protein